MANQMIALQARGPQLPDPAKLTAQYASLMNMAQQNETSKRQAAQAQQTMDFNAAQEARAAALHTPALAEAGAKAAAADIKTAMEFNAFVYTALSDSDSPQQVAAVANRIASLPQFQSQMYQGTLSDAVASMPQDPAQFMAWKENTKAKTLTAAQQMEQEYIKQTTGTEERLVGVSKYRRGPATEVPGSRIQVAQGMQYITDDRGNVRVVPKETGGGFDTPAPAVGAPSSMGAPGRGNTADVVYGFGEYGSPSKPLSTMRMGDVQNFQKELINKTRGKVGAGPNKGTGAVGTYQFTYETLQDMAPKVFGANWRDKPFTADAQEQLAKALYEERKGGNLKDTWAGLPSNRPGQYTNVPWEQVRDKIIRVESGGGPRRTPTGRTGAPASGEPPIVIAGSGAKAKPSTEGERRFGTVAKNMTASMREATAALSRSPSSAAPGTTEYIASQIPFYGDEARKFAQSGERQQFEAALLALLDGVTYINTGAGTSKTQEANYKNTYIPTYQDTPASRKAKLNRAIRFIENSKDAAGVMWTPDIDRELQKLKSAIAKINFGGSAKPKTPTKSSDGWGSAKQVGN
jgi:hypothetical protein